MPKKLSDSIINAAIDGFIAHKARLDQRIAELRAMLSGEAAEGVTTAAPTPAKHRKSSAAARMKEAQRLRLAKVRGERAATAAKTVKPRRRISKQGLKNIIAATKRRWALKRREKVASFHKKAGSKEVPKKRAA
jgi:hypothetical protein